MVRITTWDAPSKMKECRLREATSFASKRVAKASPLLGSLGGLGWIKL